MEVSFLFENMKQKQCDFACSEGMKLVLFIMIRCANSSCTAASQPMGWHHILSSGSCLAILGLCLTLVTPPTHELSPALSPQTRQIMVKKQKKKKKEEELLCDSMMVYIGLIATWQGYQIQLQKASTYV